MPTLYVTDLDGTLIRDDLTLSDWSRRELVALLESGVQITVATARSISSLTAILGDIPFRLPVVEFNGAFVTNYRTRRHHVVNAIEPGLAGDVFSAIASTGMQPFLSSFDGIRDLLFYRGIRNPGENAYHQERIALKDDRLRQVDDLVPVLRHRVVCFTLIDRREKLVDLERRLHASFSGRLVTTLSAYRYFPGWHFLSVHDARATKALGIRELQRLCGMEEAELVVFGDDVNDMDMFRIATRAVAMANARDDVKELAHELIGSNQEDSVVRWIRANSGSRS